MEYLEKGEEKLHHSQHEVQCAIDQHSRGGWHLYATGPLFHWRGQLSTAQPTAQAVS